MLQVQESALAAVRAMLEHPLKAFQDVRFKSDIGGSVGEIEVSCRSSLDLDPKFRTTIIRVVLQHKNTDMLITNILMPEGIKHQRLGKRTIRALFEVAQSFGYKLYVVDMVESFHTRLVKRNAVVINEETVMITSDTDLTGDVGSPLQVVEEHKPFDLMEFIRQSEERD